MIFGTGFPLFHLCCSYTILLFYQSRFGLWTPRPSFRCPRDGVVNNSESDCTRKKITILWGKAQQTPHPHLPRPYCWRLPCCLFKISGTPIPSYLLIGWWLRRHDPHDFGSPPSCQLTFSDLPLLPFLRTDGSYCGPSGLRAIPWYVNS